MKLQTVKIEDAECAIVPLKDYDALHDDLEDAADAEALRLSRAAPDQETIPASLVDRLCAGENSVLAWRDYRGMSPTVLASAVGVSDGELAAIESGNASVAPETLRRIAAALQVAEEDLVPAESPSPPD